MEKIFESDDKALKEIKENQTVYISRHGRGFLKEAKARQDGATHNHCECGKEKQKNWTKCEVCRSSESADKFKKLEEVEWDGKSMMVLRHDDRFFSCMEDVAEYMESNEVEFEDLQLMACEKKLGIYEINIDELNEEYCDQNGEGVSHYHPEISAKVEELNELIRKAEPKLWCESNKRIKKPVELT